MTSAASDLPSGAGPDRTATVVAQTGTFTLGDVFRAIRRSPILVLLLTIGGGAGALAVSQGLQDNYTGTAKLISDATRAGIISGASNSRNDDDLSTATITETIDTPVVLDNALDFLPPELRAKLEVSAAPAPDDAPAEALSRAALIRHMSRDLRVTDSGRSFVIDIVYNARDPELAAGIANAVAEGYLKARSDMRLSLYRKMLANLDGELKELTSRMQQADHRAQATREEARLTAMRFTTLTGERQQEAIDNNAKIYADQRDAEREVNATAAVYERLLLEHRQTQTLIGAPDMTVQLFAPAVVPLRPSGFNAKPIILAFGLLAGLLTGCSLAILRASWRKRQRHHG